MQVDLSQATNVLDRWIAASTRTLTAFMRQEMAAYRLYTVVPRLVKFIDDLTNVYVRYNRKRLKGGKSRKDCLFALASLYNVLLTLCKVGPAPVPPHTSAAQSVFLPLYSAQVISPAIALPRTQVPALLPDGNQLRNVLATMSDHGKSGKSSVLVRCCAAVAAHGTLHAVLLRGPLPEPEAGAAGGGARVRALVRLPRGQRCSGLPLPLANDIGVGANVPHHQK